MGQPSARLGDMHLCPLVNGIVPHVGGPVLAPGCPTVLIGGMPAARLGDTLVCVGPPDIIAQGEPTVLIGGQPAARMGDMTAHGGTIIIGLPTVLIGEPPSSVPKQIPVCGGPYYITDPEQEGGLRKSDGLTIEIVPESQGGGDDVIVRSHRKCSCGGANVTAGSGSAVVGSPINVATWTVGGEILDQILGLPTAGPKVLPVKMSCLGPPQSAMPAGQVRVFPSDKIKMKLESTRALAEKIPNIASMLKQLSDWIGNILHKKCDLSYEGLELELGVYASIDIPLPEITMEFEAGWKEYPGTNVENQWRAFFGWKLDIGLKIGIGLKIDVMMVGATAMGVPPPVVSLCRRILNELDQEDPLVFIELKFEISDTGGGGVEEGEPFGEIKIEGKGGLAIGAKLNVPEVLHVSFQASTEVTASVTGKATAKGMEAAYEFLKWSRIKGTASVQLDTCFFAIGFEREVELIGARGPWAKGPLWPPGKKSEASDPGDPEVE